MPWPPPDPATSGPRHSWIPPSPLREFTGPRPTMSHMKAARDARSAAVVINAGSRRGAAHELAVDTMRTAKIKEISKPEFFQQRDDIVNVTRST